MKVKFVKLLAGSGLDDLTLGEEYECSGIDFEGDVCIKNDSGLTSYLFKGEYEVIEE